MLATKALRFLATMCVLVTASLGPALPAWAAPASSLPDPPPNVPGNLLTNPGFEEPYVKQCCHDEPNFPANLPIDEVQVPSGWRAWWRQPSFPDYPPRCDDAQAPKQNCVAFHRPEWRDAAAGGTGFDVFRNRIHSGLNAQKYFTFYSIHESGMYQQVNGVSAGQRLRFTVYLQAWSSNANQDVSVGQSSMNLKVGIDPYGGTNAFSPNIVWSDPSNSYDVYTQFGIEAVAQSSTVTVFTYSRPVYALQHNDVYVDDAALTVVGSGAVQPAPAPVSPVVVTQPAPVVVNTTNPFPGTFVDASGNIIYVVQPGDTTFSIALRFGTTIQQLMTWNGLYSASYVQAWMPLIVGKASTAANPPAAPVIPVVAVPTQAPSQAAPTQVVIVPTQAVVPPTATPQPAPVAAPVVVSPGTVSPYPGTTLDSYGDIIYIVQPGDTMSGIALRFHTTVWQIMSWNGLYSATYVQAGQLLIVGHVG